MTEKAPSAQAPAEPDSSDFPAPRVRRDVAGKGSLVVPIILVAGAALLGLCVCAAPVVIFLGMVPVRMARQVEAVAQQEEAKREAVDQAVKAEAAKLLRGFDKGGADAKDAIAKDKLLLKEFPPLPAPAWHGEYIKLLKERCKCDYQVIGAPNLPKDQQDEIRGWNETMQTELRRRHGATIIADLNQDAEKRWRDGIKPKEKK